MVYLDFDDFGEKDNRLDWFWKLKDYYPKFKVNVFAIPTWNEKQEWISYIRTLDWIQLCIHGYGHKHDDDLSEDT